LTLLCLYTFEGIDLDQNPYIIPSCGHLLTLESIDGDITMSGYYSIDDQGSTVGLRGVVEPFSASGIKSCPTCRGPLRNVNRYSRIIRRALIDEAIRKFIVWANVRFVPLVARMENIRGRATRSCANIATIQSRHPPSSQPDHDHSPSDSMRFLNSRQRESTADFRSIEVYFSSNRKEFEALVSESYARSQPGNVVEGKLYWARFLALSVAWQGLDHIQHSC